MKTPTFLTDITATIGKTIDGIAMDFGVAIISFTDGTALAIDSDADYDGSVSLSPATPRITDSRWNMAAEDAGLMTHEEWLEAHRKYNTERAEYLRKQADALEGK